MLRSPRIAKIAIIVLLLLNFPASLAANEEAVAVLAVLLGCVTIVFNKQLTLDSLCGRRWRSRHEYTALEEKVGRIVVVVCGIGFVVWGASLLLGFGHIRGWN